MKQKKLIGTAAALVVLCSSCGYALGKYQAEQAQNNAVSYVKDSGRDKSDRTSLVADKTPDQISQEEGISAEQIVVKITDQGYVTSHGDHYHYYNGKVPYNAIISEELLMTDPNYHFKQSDVVNEILDGYVIKVDGKYYIYLKPGSKRKNIRTKKEIAEQVAKGTKEAKEKGLAQVAHLSKAEAAAVNEARKEGRYTTDDGYIFSPTDVINDLGDAFLVPHGDHFHYIPKKDLSPSELGAAQAYWDRKSGSGQTRPNTSSHVIRPAYRPGNGRGALPPYGDGTKPLVQPVPHKETPNNASYESLLARLYATPKSERHVESDGLVYDPAQIHSFTKDGVSVPHGNHYHFIYYSSMSPLEFEVTKLVAKANGISLDDNTLGPVTPKPGKESSSEKEKPTPKGDHSLTDEEEHYPVTPLNERQGKPNAKIVYSDKEIEAARAAGHYATSDGYIFDPTDIIEDTGEGYVTPHMDHEHWIPKKDLSEKELAAAKAFWEKKSSSNKKPVSPKPGQHKTAQEIYESIEPKALINPDDLIYGIALATEYKNGTFVIPHKDHYHYVELKWFDEDPDIFKDCEKTYGLEEYLATAKYYMEHPSERPQKDGWGTDADIHKEKNKGDQTKPSDKKKETNDVAKPIKAEGLYESVKAAQIVPLDKMPYNTAYTVSVQGDHLVIPHLDHYHNLRFSWFDEGLYTAPEGYSLSDLFATIKYYIENPSELPKKEGWGSDSDYGKQGKADMDNNHYKSEEDEDLLEEDEEVSEAEAEEDDYDRQMVELAKKYDLDVKNLQYRLAKIALTYGISMEGFSYQDTITFTANGKIVHYDIRNMTEVNS
ncbi:UNVERIFIED_CONTAM: pneumococcal-type histidine triad protein [Streptococcus canis]|nr:pneumococcal-type histidine triad protein [Streptococcus canis]QKG75589.1 pneumococcal-type histidine triad protein [Streptococcus canis]